MKIICVNPPKFVKAILRLFKKKSQTQSVSAQVGDPPKPQ